MGQVNKNYYGIIPANVRYDKRLSSSVKLLYSELTALANEKGYCWANNSYFVELYDVSKETVSRWVSQLEMNGYVKVQILYKENSKEIQERRIYINGVATIVNEKTYVTDDSNINTPIDENINTYPKKHQEPPHKNVNTPIDENVKDNNKVFNNTFNNKNNKKEKERACVCVRANNNININNNIKKDKKTDFNNLVNSYTDNEELKEAIYEFIKMRIAIKKPMTTKALELLLNKLNTLASYDYTKIKVLEQSIEHCWQTVYALKENDDGNIQNTNGYRQGIYSDTRKNKADYIGKTQGKKWNIQIKEREDDGNYDYSDVL